MTKTNQTRPLWRVLGTGPENKVPDIIYVIVEVPKGTKGKYEMDEKTGALFLSRDLFSSVVYPGDYGSIPRTFCEDNDPVDALVLVSQPHYPGVVIPSRPIALMKMIDEKGRDDKILCVPDFNVNTNFKDMKDLKDVPKELVAEIKQFFQIYKQLEPGKWLKMKEWQGAKSAKKYILDSIKLYKEKYGE